MVAGLLARSAAALAGGLATTAHGLNHTDLDGSIAVGDLISGLIPTELAGDLGWHPVNTNPADQLPAFTDDVGALSIFTGLLNDFPSPLGQPVKLVQYDLPQKVNISRIQILTGNGNNSDGRIFSTTVIKYSTDNGGSFQHLGYFQSDPSGTINNEQTPGSFGSTLVQIDDDANGTLLVSTVTNLQFNFYSVDNTGGEMRDPFDGVNPFTGVDDTLSAAFVSPLVFEIDVIGGVTGDMDCDGDTDFDDIDDLVLGLNSPADYEAQFGVPPELKGDTDGDGDLDFDDIPGFVDILAPPPVATRVPEPSSLLLAGLALLGGLARRRRSRGGRAGW